MKQFLFLSISFFVSSSYIMAQGLNNNYPLDTLDIKNSLDMLGINVFKFPIKKPERKGKYIINTIIEEYEDGKLTSNINLYKMYAGTENQANKISEILPLMQKKIEWQRLYSYQRKENELELKLYTTNRSDIFRFSCDTSKYNLYGTRAMDFNGELSDKTKTPLFVYYRVAKNANMVGCPGNAKPEDIVNRYGYAIIVYGKYEKVE